MGLDTFFRCLDVSSSGMSAERARMDVVAQNLANAYVTRGEDGLPYRRRTVAFESILGRKEEDMRGVRVRGVEMDKSPFLEIVDPGHPDADANGVVLMPNVKVSFEMVDLITAARSYEANLNLIRTFRDMVERSLKMGS